MSKKLKFLFKLSVGASIFTGLFVLLFLQEVAVFGDGFIRACGEKGISLPLQDPNILVDVSDSTLTIKDGEVVIRRYDVSTGSGKFLGALDKDGKATPLGEYRVTRKSVRESVLFHGSRFLQFNFPSEEDIENAWDQGLINRTEYERYYDAVANGSAIPTNLSISRELGIQGNYFAILGAKSTNGGIALSNGDINEIFEHIPVGTPVVIRR